MTNTAWRGQAGLDVTNADDGSRDWGDLSTRRGLAAGDLVTLTAFAYVGRASHGMASLDLGVLVTALPFLVGVLCDCTWYGVQFTWYGSEEENLTSCV